VIQRNISLKSLNTFAFDVKASQYLVLDRIEQLDELFSKKVPDYMVLGGGSNICFTGDQEKLILHNQIKGIEVESMVGDDVLVKIGAGENWHEVVCWCLDRNLGGIENLSLIPGYAGAAPIQNIGAYGVELQDVFYSLDAFDTLSGRVHRFNKTSCNFGYRDSYFKQSGKGRYIILSICLLLKRPPHKLNLDYGAIRQVLAQNGIENPSIRDVSQAVIAIRQSKLPDPSQIGNAGSFFKNPVVDRELFNELQKKNPGMPYFPQSDERVKIPAGWLIEQAGWKGYREGHVGVHKDQALVLVHFGEGSGREILDLSASIMDDIATKFGIRLEPEVNII